MVLYENKKFQIVMKCGYMTNFMKFHVQLWNPATIRHTYNIYIIIIETISLYH